MLLAVNSYNLLPSKWMGLIQPIDLLPRALGDGQLYVSLVRTPSRCRVIEAQVFWRNSPLLCNWGQRTHLKQNHADPSCQAVSQSPPGRAACSSGIR